jgi:mono/diheme cytochrome c family protein
MTRALPQLTRSEHEGVRSTARDLAASLGIGLDPEMLLRTIADGDARRRDRVAALRAAMAESDAVRQRAIDAAARSDLPELRVEAMLAQLPSRDPDANTLRAMLLQGSVPERAAAAAALPRIEGALGEALIAEALDAIERDVAPLSIQLEVVEAAMSRFAESSTLSARATDYLARLDAAGGLGRYRLALEGGDAERGDRVVHQHASAVCLKCHAIDGFGGNAAPELRGVSARLSREEILESLVLPNKKISEGYGPASAMPGMHKILSQQELRDVVEYLSSL